MIALALASMVAPSVVVAVPSSTKAETAAGQAISAYDEDDCPTALNIALPLMGSAATSLPAATRARLYDLAVDCTFRAKNRDAAYAFAVDATRTAESSDYVWRMRFLMELIAKRDDVALATIEEMNRGRGEALNAVPVQWIGDLYRRFDARERPAQRTRLLKILADNAYQPLEPLTTNDPYRLDYALILVKAGRLDEARALLAMVKLPETLGKIMFDQRLKEVRPNDIDLRVATERELAGYRTAIGANPRLIAPVVYAADNLIKLGRPQEALDTLKAIESSIADTQAFDDSRTLQMWWWNSLAKGYAALGRYDDALAAYKGGMTQNEKGGVNVSQTINLASLQLRTAKFSDAIATLGILDDPTANISPYGHSVMRLVRGCAYQATGEIKKADADLAYLVAHEKDNADGLAAMLVCRGETDKAAADIIKQLDDPDLHANALLELSDYDPPITRPPNDFDAEGTRMLKARPDVRAAIARAGGIRRIHLQK